MPKDIYAELLNEPANLVSSTKTCSNVQPRIKNTPYKISIIGEAPGNDEIDQGIPFVGYSGRELDRFLSRFGILRDACFVGNVCQHQPPGNKIANFDWEGNQIQNGLQRLADDAKSYKPNVILLLGATALHAFKSGAPLKKRKSKEGLVFSYPFPIGRWRGTFFLSHSQAPWPNTKCVASYHPAACLRNYEWTPVLMFDIQRMLGEATFPEWNPPERTLLINLTFEQTCQELEKVIATKPLTSIDIEGGIGTMSCISFATAPNYGFIVPFSNSLGGSYWSLDEEVKIWKLLLAILSNPKIPKVLQNGLYDRFVLQYGYDVIIQGVVDDTLLKHWELYCEMRKSLAYQASVYTKEPYWKEMRLQAEQESEEA